MFAEFNSFFFIIRCCCVSLFPFMYRGTACNMSMAQLFSWFVVSFTFSSWFVLLACCLLWCIRAHTRQHLCKMVFGWWMLGSDMIHNANSQAGAKRWYWTPAATAAATIVESHWSGFSAFWWWNVIVALASKRQAFSQFGAINRICFRQFDCLHDIVNFYFFLHSSFFFKRFFSALSMNWVAESSLFSIFWLLFFLHKGSFEYS